MAGRLRAMIKFLPIYSMQNKGGASITSFMDEPQDSKLLRGFSLFIGSIAIIGLFMGEVISIPISALFLAYGFGGSKFLKKIGLGHFNEEKITKDKRTNPHRESP